MGSVASIGVSLGICTLASKTRHCLQFLRAKVASLAILGHQNCSFSRLNVQVSSLMSHEPMASIQDCSLFYVRHDEGKHLFLGVGGCCLQIQHLLLDDEVFLMKYIRSFRPIWKNTQSNTCHIIGSLRWSMGQSACCNLFIAGYFAQVWDHQSQLLVPYCSWHIPEFHQQCLCPVIRFPCSMLWPLCCQYPSDIQCSCQSRPKQPPICVRWHPDWVS